MLVLLGCLGLKVSVDNNRSLYCIQAADARVATNKDGVTESFWGFDHLGQLADFLGVEKPSHGGWKAVL
jgi:hypothetical protein